MEFFPFLLTGGEAGAAGGGGVASMVPFVAIIAIFYFFIIRPQNKKQKETQKMIAGAKKGDKIITIGGIHGTVSATDEKTVVVKVDDNCKLKFNRSAIATVVVDKVESAGSDKAEKKEKISSEKSSPEKISDIDEKEEKANA